MTPAQKRKIRIAIKEYRQVFLSQAARISDALEYGVDIPVGDKRDMIRAHHQHKVADHLQAIMDGEL